MAAILHHLAERGDTEAQYRVALLYYEGNGVKQSQAEALRWFLKAAESGHRESQYLAGFCIFNGHGIEPDPAQSIQWFTRAADSGEVEAQRQLAVCYREGLGVVQNHTKAFEWFKKAANQGDASAQCWLGTCYSNGEGVDRNDIIAFDCFFKAAHQGHPVAQVNLGVCYCRGKGTTQDYGKAQQWLIKAAQQGDPDAQCQLGVLYYNGEGVTENYPEAFKWYTSSALQGYAEAQFYLGLCYLLGEGTEINAPEAFRWLLRSSAQGNADAQYQLGLCYMKGQGTDEDKKEGFKCLKKSAKNGIAEAQYQTGLCYLNAQGTRKNEFKAFKWFGRASEQGHSDSTFQKALCMLEGKGTKTDGKKGALLLTELSHNGHEEAAKRLKEIQTDRSEGVQCRMRHVQDSIYSMKQQLHQLNERLFSTMCRGKSVKKKRDEFEREKQVLEEDIANLLSQLEIKQIRQNENSVQLQQAIADCKQCEKLTAQYKIESENIHSQLNALNLREEQLSFEMQEWKRIVMKGLPSINREELKMILTEEELSDTTIELLAKNKIDGKILDRMTPKQIRRLGIDVMEVKKIKSMVRRVRRGNGMKSVSEVENYGCIELVDWLNKKQVDNSVIASVINAKLNGRLFLEFVEDDFEQMGVDAFADRLQLMDLIDQELRCGAVGDCRPGSPPRKDVKTGDSVDEYPPPEEVSRDQ